MAINLHIVRNPVSHDSRVLKETEAAFNSGLFSHVDIAGFHENGYSEHEMLGDRNLWRVKLSCRGLSKNLLGQAIKFLEWKHRVVSRYKNAPLSLIHCDDLEPLPIAVALKRKTGARLVYDAHELETERAGMNTIRKFAASITERRCMPWVDAITTVSPSILEWYRREYPDKRIGLVRNIPDRLTSVIEKVDIRNILSVPDDALLFIYLGGLSRGRGIETMLSAFTNTDVPHHLLIMGSGVLRDDVDAAVNSCPRIHYRKPIPPSEVLSYIAGADVGVCLIEDVCLSYRYCLPNKLFESLLAGLPVLASDFPDMSDIVKRYNGGWVVQNDKGAIVNLLSSIKRSDVEFVKAGLQDRVADLSWDNEAKVLLDIYKELLQERK